jgi:predicted permease
MEYFVGDNRDRLLVLLAAVGLVLLIACGNVSNLLLARGASRSRELALRSALGAGQGRLVRQLLTESLVLGTVAAVAGVALAHWFIQLLLLTIPPGIPRVEQASLDGSVLVFGIVIALAASVLFGLIPAWRAARVDVNSTLKEGSRGGGSPGTKDGVRSTLIAAEVALALVLLVGAGLLIRTAIETQRVSLGFDPQQIFTGRMLLSPTKYRDPGSRVRVTRELEEAVGSIPGVRSVAVSNVVPGVRGFSNGLLPEGRAQSLDNITQADGVLVTPSYFASLKLPVIQGRAFTDMDRPGTPLVVILNRTAAERMWPGENAIGRRLTSANPLGAT